MSKYQINSQNQVIRVITTENIVNSSNFEFEKNKLQEELEKIQNGREKQIITRLEEINQEIAQIQELESQIEAAITIN
jgi:flagellar hook-associated protein FlgK